MSKPTYEIKIIIPGENGGKDRFFTVGALWPTKSGNGFSGTSVYGKVLLSAPFERDGAYPTPQATKEDNSDVPF